MHTHLQELLQQQRVPWRQPHALLQREPRQPHLALQRRAVRQAVPQHRVVRHLAGGGAVQRQRLGAVAQQGRQVLGGEETQLLQGAAQLWAASDVRAGVSW